MRIKFIIAILFMSLNLGAHTLLMNVLDNEDGTISVEGMFNTGEVTVGAMVRLESLVSGEILYKKRLPQEGELIIDIPKEEYQVVLDGGPGHILVEKGIAPKNGFVEKKIKENNKELSKQTQGGSANTHVVVLFSLAFILIILALFFSARNTKILMNRLESIKKSR